MAILRIILTPFRWLITVLSPLRSERIRLAEIELERQALVLKNTETQLALAEACNHTNDKVNRLTLQMLAEHPKMLEKLAALVAKKESEVYERILTAVILTISGRSDQIQDPLALAFLQLAEAWHSTTRPDQVREFHEIAQTMVPWLATNLTNKAKEQTTADIAEWLESDEGLTIVSKSVSKILAQLLDSSSKPRQSLQEEVNNNREARNQTANKRCFPNGKPVIVIDGCPP